MLETTIELCFLLTASQAERVGASVNGMKGAENIDLDRCDCDVVVVSLLLGHLPHEAHEQDRADSGSQHGCLQYLTSYPQLHENSEHDYDPTCHTQIQDEQEAHGDEEAGQGENQAEQPLRPRRRLRLRLRLRLRWSIPPRFRVNISRTDRQHADEPQQDTHSGPPAREECKHGCGSWGRKGKPTSEACRHDKKIKAMSERNGGQERRGAR